MYYESHDERVQKMMQAVKDAMKTSNGEYLTETAKPGVYQPVNPDELRDNGND